MMVTEIQISKFKKFNALTKECIIHLHELLTKNALIVGSDPVSPPGVKNFDGLESATERQFTGSGEWFKYDTVYSNCATLIYGINKNHIFHNGNKRASFLAMIKHLYVNGLVFEPNTNHDDIYALILAIADEPGSIQAYANKLSRGGSEKEKAILNRVGKSKKWQSEDEINYIGYWLANKTISKDSIVPKRSIKFSELKNLLELKGLTVEQGSNTRIFTVFAIKEERIFWGLSTRTKRVNERSYKIGKQKLSEVSKEVVDLIRQDFNLKISDGIDNNSFYDPEAYIDEQMKVYKGLIYRLSKT